MVEMDGSLLTSEYVVLWNPIETDDTPPRPPSTSCQVGWSGSRRDLVSSRVEQHPVRSSVDVLGEVIRRWDPGGE
jgi:hypothetical protein